MTHKELQALIKEGYPLAISMLSDINAAGWLLRPNAEKLDGDYRRECDFNELCVVLALYNRKLKVLS